MKVIELLLVKVVDRQNNRQNEIGGNIIDNISKNMTCKTF